MNAKFKIQKNSLYGIFAEEVAASFRICSEQVRETPCKKCLHYAECMNNGLPCNRLARYLATLTCSTLPALEREINKIADEPIALSVRVPNSSEEGRAYAVVRCKTITKYSQRRLFVLRLEGPISFVELRARVYNEYLRSLLKKRKTNNGK